MVELRPRLYEALVKAFGGGPGGELELDLLAARCRTTEEMRDRLARRFGTAGLERLDRGEPPTPERA